MQNSLISICIPAFNSAKFIGETIKSLLNQTYSHLEIIVVDDGSTDNTINILKDIKDARFRYITQLNKGAAVARNEAFKMSRGEYIKFMDCDDLINLNCIESQVDKIKSKYECVASAKWGRFYDFDASDFKLSPEKVWRNLRGIDWLVNSLIDTGTNMMQPGIFLIPRSVIEKAGLWNADFSLIDDFEFMTRIVLNCAEVVFCEDAVLMYRSGVSNSLSAQKSFKHMQSAFKSLTVSINRILKMRNDEQSRLACANTYQAWAFQFYPDHLGLLYEAEKNISKLGGSNINIPGGMILILIARIFGWKRALNVKKFLNS